jgi:Cu2+-exporting ATPase
MTCASCVSAVERTLASQQGVTEVSVNLASHKATITYNDELITPEAMQSSLHRIGYELEIEEPSAMTDNPLVQAVEKKRLFIKRLTLIGVFTLSMLIMYLSMLEVPTLGLSYVIWVLTSVVLFGFGFPYYKKAYRLATAGQVTMDTLISLSTGVAYLFSVFNTVYPEFWELRGLEAHLYFDASSMILSFVMLGKYLEEQATHQTTTAIKKLMALQPKTVIRIVTDQLFETIPIAHVEPGDVLLVKPGDRIPVDGRVKAGHSYVDEHMLTGESIPTEKNPASQVFTGTINQQSVLHIVADKVGSETLLSQMIRMVEESQGSKAPIQRLVDKVSAIFVPVVILLAIFTFVSWIFLGGSYGWVHGLLSMITVLVIACPCALGLATPTALMVGIGKAAERGLFIKNAESLERAHRITDIVFDKTGTLTTGSIQVNHRWWLDPADQAVGECILYAIERQSNHPLAKGITQSLALESDLLPTVSSIIEIPGKGILASVSGKTYWVGNQALIEERKTVIPDKVLTMSQLWQDQGHSLVWFAEGGRLKALYALMDQLSDQAQSTIHLLKTSSIKVHLVSGDQQRVVTHVANTLDIAEYRFGVLPAEKSAYIRALQEKGSVVAMIGDGINDSQALALADVSIAMGKGTDIAMEVSDITVLSNDISAIPYAITLSQKTYQTIKQNLFWAFIYNMVGLPIAAGVLYPINGFLLNPMIASAAMALSSVSVVLNSLRLRITT